MTLSSTLNLTSDRLLSQVRTARQKGTDWLAARVGDDGRPEGSEIRNAWWRAPWALCVGGAPDAAAAMLGWIEREALTDDGQLRDGVYGGGGPHSPVYEASPIAIAAWLLGRYGTANAVMDALETWIDPTTGGAYDFRNFHENPAQDMLRTSQLGISALVTGRTATAEGIHTWLTETYNAQTELPHRLYTSRRGSELVTDFTAAKAFLSVVDFREKHQAYYQPGIAAAFLAGHGQQANSPEALELAAKYLAISENGTQEQYTDTTSVQVCKVGWGHAALYTASANASRREWVEKLANWFMTRQNPDGSWAPASFVTPEPGLLDYYWKTAEHVMELSYIEQALSAAPVTDRT